MFLTLLLSGLLTFVELNCENLFDTKHDSLKNDLAFTPDGSYHWTRTRYWNKLNHIAKELIALGEHEHQEWRIPDLVALCEVENDTVLTDLTKRSLLRRAGYEYLMTSSPDERGIDVALMYIPSSFSPLRSYPIRIRPVPGMRPTRDILYVSGLVSMVDTLHVLVVHAPSRRGGETASRPYRLQVARQMSETIDSIFTYDRDARIIVAGDFNDYSESPALQMLCDGSRLVEVSRDATGRHGAEATYRWRGEWRSLDHILCSQTVAKCSVACYIGDLPFLLEEDERYGGFHPWRSFLGPRYQGGYSDHLPLVFRFHLNDNSVK